jgi:hypothetical protein
MHKRSGTPVSACHMCGTQTHTSPHASSTSTCPVTPTQAPGGDVLPSDIAARETTRSPCSTGAHTEVGLLSSAQKKTLEEDQIGVQVLMRADAGVVTSAQTNTLDDKRDTRRDEQQMDQQVPMRVEHVPGGHSGVAECPAPSPLCGRLHLALPARIVAATLGVAGGEGGGEVGCGFGDASGGLSRLCIHHLKYLAGVGKACYCGVGHIGISFFKTLLTAAHQEVAGACACACACVCMCVVCDVLSLFLSFSFSLSHSVSLSFSYTHTCRQWNLAVVGSRRQGRAHRARHILESQHKHKHKQRHKLLLQSGHGCR